MRIVDEHYIIRHLSFNVRICTRGKFTFLTVPKKKGGVHFSFGN